MTLTCHDLNRVDIVCARRQRIKFVPFLAINLCLRTHSSHAAHEKQWFFGKNKARSIRSRL